MMKMYAYYFHKNILYIRIVFKRFSNEIREKLVCKLLPEHVMIDTWPKSKYASVMLKQHHI